MLTAAARSARGCSNEESKNELELIHQVRLLQILFLLLAVFRTVLWIRIHFYADPDPVDFFNADPDPDLDPSGSRSRVKGDIKMSSFWQIT
jgi:hypothetical protein